MTRPKLPPREAMRILADGGEVYFEGYRVLITEEGNVRYFSSGGTWQPSSTPLLSIIQNCTLPPPKPDPFREVDEEAGKALYGLDDYLVNKHKVLYRTIINTAVKMAKGEN